MMGSTNTGKSKLTRLVGQVLDTSEYTNQHTWTSHDDAVDIVTGQVVEPNCVTMNEMNNTLFTSGTKTDFKLLMEGAGCLTQLK